MARLLFYRGEDLLIDYRLRPGRMSIGRADTCDVALPGEAISRTHCFVEGQGEAWEVIDRSRHGTLVDGVAARRARLSDGSRVGLGPYTVELRLRDPDAAGPTAEAAPDRGHEMVVATVEEGLHVERAFLVVVSGGEVGRRYELKSSRVSLGACPSPIALPDDSLVPDHCRLRISRGRVMIEPGAGAAYLDGARVRDITPLYAGEELRVGQTVLRVELGSLDEEPVASRFAEMVGDSPTMHKLFGVLRRMAGHHFPVLITGESGTGKELAARGIHDHSPRATGPFIAVNCGAIPEALFESELFGHERGAFTGAVRRADGAFHRAEGGTLFLDEIGELPESAQAKLLRALESGEVRRVGGAEVTYPDVRVVAATNRDLAMEAGSGNFREDLFFRLAVLSVNIPPLRKHLEDLPALCRALTRDFKPEAQFTDAAMEVLSSHDWPGNVRELRNVLTRAHVLGGPRIDVDAITFHSLSRSPAPTTEGGAVDDAERAYVASVLKRHGDNRSAAARELGLARSTLHYKLKRLGLL